MMKNTAPALQDIRNANETCSNYNTIPISSTHGTLENTFLNVSGISDYIIGILMYACLYGNVPHFRAQRDSSYWLT